MFRFTFRSFYLSAESVPVVEDGWVLQPVWTPWRKDLYSLFWIELPLPGSPVSNAGIIPCDLSRTFLMIDVFAVIAVFGCSTPCSLLAICQRIGVIYCPHPQEFLRPWRQQFPLKRSYSCSRISSDSYHKLLGRDDRNADRYATRLGNMKFAVFWDIMSCSLYWRWVSRFLRNIGVYINHTTRRLIPKDSKQHGTCCIFVYLVYMV